jgi:hypothetical protein
MGVAIGSSIQIALLVTPSLVILGWLVLDQPMSMHFETCKCRAVPYCTVSVPCLRLDLTRLGSRNRGLRPLCLGRYVHRAGRQVQLPGRGYAYGTVSDHRARLLGKSQWSPRQGAWLALGMRLSFLFFYSSCNTTSLRKFPALREGKDSDTSRVTQLYLTLT